MQLYHNVKLNVTHLELVINPVLRVVVLLVITEVRLVVIAVGADLHVAQVVLRVTLGHPGMVVVVAAPA